MVTYTKNGDYLLPDLYLENKDINFNLSKYALLKLNYLKQYNKVLYMQLLNSDKLTEYLNEVQLLAEKRLDFFINQLKEKEHITEHLKSNNQMLWVQKMNSIKSIAEEIILNELIYE